MRKKSGQLVAANPNVTGLLSRRLQAMRDGEMRMRVQHVRLGTPLIKENARRVTACMPSNYLAPLVPRGEETRFSGDAFDTQRRGQTEPFGWPATAKLGIESSLHGGVSRCDTSPL